MVEEISVNHNGSIDRVMQLIDMAKICGADGVKTQKHTQMNQ